MVRLATVLVLTALAALACATPGGQDPFPYDPEGIWSPESRPDLMIRVENRHIDPVVVSASWRTSRYFLGEVQPGGTSVYQIPGHLLDSQGDPKLVAKAKGRAIEEITDPIRCDRVRWVEWRLRRHLMSSRLVILGL